MATFWDDLGIRVGTTVLVTPLAVAWWKASEYLLHRWYNRKLRRLADRHAAAAGVRPVALALSVGDDITESVRGHLRDRGLLGAGADIPLRAVHQREGFGASEGQWFAYLAGVKAEMRTIRELGAVRVHIYARLPVAQAMMVGATLTNGPAVVVYHYSGGRYEAAGQVTFETIKL